MVLYEVKEENINILPHSDYELIIPSKDNNIESGEYILQIKMMV